MQFIKRNSLAIVTAAILLILSGIILSWFLPLQRAEAEPLDTYHSSWHLVRAAAAEDAADFATALPLATSEGDFANKPSGAFRIFSPTRMGRAEGYSPGSKWMFALCGGPTDNDTFSFNVVGWAKTNGMAQVICEGNGVLGTQDVVIYPGGAAAANTWWVDTIALDEETKWPGSVSDSNGVSVFNSADNEVCLLVIETTGLEWIQFIVYDADGSGTEMGSVAVYGRRY